MSPGFNFFVEKRNIDYKFKFWQNVLSYKKICLSISRDFHKYNKKFENDKKYIQIHKKVVFPRMDGVNVSIWFVWIMVAALSFLKLSKMLNTIFGFSCLGNNYRSLLASKWKHLKMIPFIFISKNGSFFYLKSGCFAFLEVYKDC